MFANLSGLNVYKNMCVWSNLSVGLPPVPYFGFKLYNYNHANSHIHQDKYLHFLRGEGCLLPMMYQLLA